MFFSLTVPFFTACMQLSRVRIQEVGLQEMNVEEIQCHQDEEKNFLQEDIVLEEELKSVYIA